MSGVARERLVSLDVFRGLTIAGMLLVNQPGSWGAIYPPLAHAAWHGWTPTDLIFPFFLFIVGVTTHLSLSARRAAGADDRVLVRQILRRGAIIILLGLFLSWFPGFESGRIPDVESPTIWERISWRLSHLRFPGVLQRIGVAYIAAALLSLRTTRNQRAVIVVALLFGYWFAMTLLPVPGHGMGQLMLDSRSGNLAAWIDRAVIGEAHLWSGSRVYDPEGLLSTLPAIATAMLGIFAGEWIRQPRPLIERIAGLFAVGAIATMVGLMWHWSFPINKNIWTSSYVMFTAGMACITLATCMWLIEERNVRWWTRPFVIFGVNPILAFVGSGLMARLIYSLIKVPYGSESISLQAAIYRSAFASWLPPRDASLLFAIAFVLLWLGILTLLYRRGIVLKV